MGCILISCCSSTQGPLGAAGPPGFPGGPGPKVSAMSLRVAFPERIMFIVTQFSLTYSTSNFLYTISRGIVHTQNSFSNCRLFFIY